MTQPVEIHTIGPDGQDPISLEAGVHRAPGGFIGRVTMIAQHHQGIDVRWFDAQQPRRSKREAVADANAMAGAIAPGWGL